MSILRTHLISMHILKCYLPGPKSWWYNHFQLRSVRKKTDLYWIYANNSAAMKIRIFSKGFQSHTISNCFKSQIREKRLPLIQKNKTTKECFKVIIITSPLSIHFYLRRRHLRAVKSQRGWWRKENLCPGANVSMLSSYSEIAYLFGEFPDLN